MFSPLVRLLLSSLSACFKSPLPRQFGEKQLSSSLLSHCPVASVLSCPSFQRRVFFLPLWPAFHSLFRGFAMSISLDICLSLNDSCSFSQIPKWCFLCRASIYFPGQDMFVTRVSLPAFPFCLKGR